MAAWRGYRGRSSGLGLSGRRHAAILVCGVLLAACGSTVPATSSPTAGSPAPTPAVAGSAGPTSSTPSLPTGGAWVAAGTVTTARLAPRLVLLGDGRVLAVGNDRGCIESFRGAPYESEKAELWDPASGAWAATKALDTPRAALVAVTLSDGRALVAAGANEGIWDKHSDRHGYQSYSSAWIFDPQSETWSRTGLLGAARTAAAGAVLADGRVLVAGGYFADLFDVSKYPWLEDGSIQGRVAGSPDEPSLGGVGTAVTAAWPVRGELADVIPPGPPTKVLATAELYDPANGTWSRTGPMAVPRYGATAVTLADGRVLVAGDSNEPIYAYDTYYDRPDQDVAEVFDPAKGRFSVTGELPAHGQSALLVALPDGGALLIGGYGDEGMPVATVLRFDGATARWTQTGSLARPRANAIVSRLPDGSILVAGGEDLYGATATAEVYHPDGGAWAAVASMPEPRTAASSVTLRDGSVLVAGGYGPHSHSPSRWCNEPALTTAVRFVPGP